MGTEIQHHLSLGCNKPQVLDYFSSPWGVKRGLEEADISNEQEKIQKSDCPPQPAIAIRSFAPVFPERALANSSCGESELQSSLPENSSDTGTTA